MLDVEFAQLSDPGRVRPQNEDYMGYVAPATEAQARSHGWLFALADGVGGHDRGEVASRMAVESLCDGFRAAGNGESFSNLLPRLVQTANTSIFEAGLKTKQGGNAMATTLVACALRYDHAVIAHVGDSRCYLVHRGSARQLTRDHTFASEQARLGLISKEEAAESANRHVLSRSLGGELFVSPDISHHEVSPGDVIVQCCDGLHGSVGADDIAQIVTRIADLSEAAQKLVTLANERDGRDNITVQVVRVRAVERMGMYRGRLYKLP